MQWTLSNWLLADLSIINNLYLAAVALHFVCVGGNQPISAHSRPTTSIIIINLLLRLSLLDDLGYAVMCILKPEPKPETQVKDF